MDIDFFYFEKQQRPVLSKPVNVNLLFKEEVEIQSNQQEAKVEQATNPEVLYQIDNKIELTPVIPDININQISKHLFLARKPFSILAKFFLFIPTLRYSSLQYNCCSRMTTDSCIGN